MTITLGFNEPAALSPAANTPALEAAALANVPAELAAYRGNYGKVLADIRATAPAASYGANFIAAAPGFVGRETALTYEAAQPAGSPVAGPYGGVLPIGNVHPNAAGYGVIAGAFAAPEPSPLAVAVVGLALLGLLARGPVRRVPVRVRGRS